MKIIAHYLPVTLFFLSPTPCFSALKQGTNSNVPNNTLHAFNDFKHETIDDGCQKNEEQSPPINFSYGKGNVVLSPQAGKAQDICEAAAKGDLKAVQDIFPNSCQADKDRALIKAAANGQLKVVKFLASKIKDIVILGLDNFSAN